MDHLPSHLQAERRRCTASDAARKRSARKWIYRKMPVPPSLWRRETEEFDLLHGVHGHHALPPPPAPPAPSAPATPSASLTLPSSSSGSWISAGASSPRTPASQAREVAVDDDGFELYDPAAFEGSVTREDFVPDDFLETVTDAVQARSKEEQDQRRREQDRLRREQAASASASAARDKGKAVVIYIDDDDSE